MPPADAVPGPGGPPGTAGRRRGRWYPELIVCGVRGHALVGTDVAADAPADPALVRPSGRLRWHRCLRCDAWLPLAAPAPGTAARARMPERSEIALPLRGRPLRDRLVLRLIALDRVLHVIAFSLAAVGVFVFAADRRRWRDGVAAVLEALHPPLAPASTRPAGLLGEVVRAFTVDGRILVLLGVGLAAYALLEAAEVVGLWRGRRWAEYLTLVATAVFLVPETVEIARGPTVPKLLTLLVNVAVVVYLLLAKRLFGLRGGTRSEEAVRARDLGWPALDRATPAGGPAESPDVTAGAPAGPTGTPHPPRRR